MIVVYYPLAIYKSQIRLEIRIAFHSSFSLDYSIFKQDPMWELRHQF